MNKFTKVYGKWDILKIAPLGNTLNIMQTKFKDTMQFLKKVKL